VPLGTSVASMVNPAVFHRLSATCILSLMPSTATFHESRRSTRVPLKVVITVEGGAETLTCEGETIVVNLHGALIATAIGLSVGMRVSIHVYLTNKRAAARVVYVDPKNSLHCGIELDEPRNIWGVSLPPDDWDERDRQ
jgi:PilZ domain